jgi:4-hydroxy-tetrahydrodipicolinate synthase
MRGIWKETAMAAKEFAGIFPYLISPVDGTTGRVLEAPLRALVDHLIAAGVHGLSPLGSTGEFAYLTAEQRAEIVRIVVDQTAGRVPVVPGVAACGTFDAIQQAARYRRLGCDGIVLILQTFFPLGRAAVESYFRTVAEAVPDCSVVLYANPQFGTADLPPDLVESLSATPNIRYFKEASGNTGRILTCLNRVGDRLKMFSASAHIPVLVFQLGGVGWMAGPACLVPRESVRLYDLCRAGQWEAALAAQRELWRVNELFARYNLAGCIKAGLRAQGFAVGDPIPPQEPLGPQAEAEIRDALARLAARAEAAPVL